MTSSGLGSTARLRRRSCGTRAFRRQSVELVVHTIAKAVKPTDGNLDRHAPLGDIYTSDREHRRLGTYSKQLGKPRPRQLGPDGLFRLDKANAESTFEHGKKRRL